MPSTPTFKNLGALIEQPTSRQVGSGSDGITETRIYCATHSVCRAALKAQNAVGADDLTGYIVKQSNVTRQRGDIGTLTDVWVAGGPDANPEDTPLPPDRVSLQSQDLNPSVEKNLAFQHAITSGVLLKENNTIGSGGQTLLSWVRRAGLTANDTDTERAFQVLVNAAAIPPLAAPNDAQFYEALVLADFLRRGVQNFYKATFVYQWEQSFFSEPAVSVGGKIETPTGPLADAIAALELVCLRQADDMQFDGHFYVRTRRWICAQDDNNTFWEPILYTDP